MEDKEKKGEILENKNQSKINEKEENITNNTTEKEKNNTKKYKIKYGVMINFLKSEDRDQKEYYNSNEYWCNILLMPTEIEFFNKISILNLLSKYYQKKRNKELIYKLAYKFDKCIDSFNTLDPVFAINSFNSAIQNLNNQNTFLYAYRYMTKIKKLIEKNIVSIKKNYSIKNINDFFNEIKNDSINFINNYKMKYMDDNYFKIEEIYKLKELIDSLLIGKYNIENDANNVENDSKTGENDVNTGEKDKKIEDNNNINNQYLYVVNKEWLFKTKLFIENYIKAKEQNIKNFYEESFEHNYIYNSYFNEKNEKRKNSGTGFYAFPGPINNFEITSFKDYWIDFVNLDENDFIKKGMELDKNYYLIKNDDWQFIKTYFGFTNEIKRRKNNLDLVQLKFILFDKRIKTENDNIHLLKQKYIQINKNSSIGKLKDKIINIINTNFKQFEEEEDDIEETKDNKKDKENKENEIKENNEEEEKNINKEEQKMTEKIKETQDKEKTNKQISFYILDKNKRKVLMEMCISFVIENSVYDSIYLEKLNLSDETSLTDFLNIYNKDKHILIVEISNKKKENFLVDLKLKMNNDYKCTICDKKIENIKDKYNCDICDLSLFCSKKCSKESEDHMRLHNQMSQFLEKQFVLSDLLSLDLESILSDSTNYGRVGLINMGNTCYLNSALQCLSNTEDLTKYFLKKYFKTEINCGSSLGSKGFISGEYYKFINRIWNGGEKEFCPKEFRIKFCKKTGLFLNSEQQDSQEFLLAVLDNLHEDLNRISNKKYMELEEKKPGESDEQASKRWWDYYRSRENSIIVDLFQGQYKSTIKCSSCNNTSISYDTYMSLGLPIPTKGTQGQIKFLTKEQNFFDINFKIDENVELKDIIQKAKSFVNINKYIEYLKHNENKNTNDKIPENIINNNIEVIEFNKGFKMNNIYKSNLKIKIEALLKNNNNSEIILFERDINIDSQNCCYVYIYPMTEKEISGIFSSSIKRVILSYPIIITIKYDNTLEELEAVIYEKLERILKRDVKNKNPIEICFPHFTKGWGRLKIQNGECPICQKKYDKVKKKFCYLFNGVDKKTKISQFQNNQNKGRPLILYAKSQYYNLSKEIYSGIAMFNENSKIKNKNVNLNIYDAFNLFNKEEILDGDNMWYCNKCKQHNRAEKKIEIYRTPIYLIIQLKRFKHRNNLARILMGNKNETFIEYKQVLNLKDFVVGPDKDKSIYNLYGVIIHKKFMNGGHYYAYCKNKGLWITFDDEKLYKCSNPVDKDAYLLFFKRKNFE